MLNLFVVVVLKHLVPFSPNFRAGVVIQWNLQCQLQNCCDHLQFSPMVVIDTTSRYSIFIEETVQKWCKKMGKMRLALLLTAKVRTHSLPGQNNVVTSSFYCEILVIKRNNSFL